MISSCVLLQRSRMTVHTSITSCTFLSETRSVLHQYGLHKLLLQPKIELRGAKFYKPLFKRKCHDIKKLSEMLHLVAAFRRYTAHSGSYLSSSYTRQFRTKGRACRPDTSTARVISICRAVCLVALHRFPTVRPRHCEALTSRFP